MKMKVFFDVDGTLAGHNGPITSDITINLKRNGVKTFMLSKIEDRGVASAEERIRDLENTFGFTACDMEEGRDYIEIKVNTLNRMLIKGEKAVYVGDRTEDFIVAMKAGVIYCSPSAFSERICDEALIRGLKAIL